jgi:hypothetical protein
VIISGTSEVENLPEQEFFDRALLWFFCENSSVFTGLPAALQYDSNEATDRLLDGDLVRNSVRHCCTVEVVRRRSREIVEASSPPPLLNWSDSGTVSKLVLLGEAENENLGGWTRPPKPREQWDRYSIVLRIWCWRSWDRKKIVTEELDLISNEKIERDRLLLLLPPPLLCGFVTWRLSA